MAHTFLKDDFTEITVGNKSALVDSSMSHLAHMKWYLHSRGYAYTKNSTLMHHLVIGKPPKGMVVDHINQNKLDNRRQNLRFVTPTESVINRSTRRGSSGHKGVFRVPSGRWRAHIAHDYKTIYLGTFDTLGEAIAAREAAEARYARV